MAALIDLARERRRRAALMGPAPAMHTEPVPALTYASPSALISSPSAPAVPAPEPEPTVAERMSQALAENRRLMEANERLTREFESSRPPTFSIVKHRP